jgi:hypothetical protein
MWPGRRYRPPLPDEAPCRFGSDSMSKPLLVDPDPPWYFDGMRFAILLLAVWTGCSPPAEPEPPPTLDPPDPAEGFQLALTGIVAPPHEEVWQCAVYPIPIDEPANVNWVHYLQNEGMHHMTLSTLGLGPSELEYGEFPCPDVYATPGFMSDQIMFFGGQGTAEDEMHLPDGVVATLPETIDIIHEIHFVNVTDEPIELYSYVNAYTIAPEDVTDGIWGGSVRDENIVIPPSADSYSEWSRCEFNRDVEVQFLASHTHGRGREFTIAPWDGATTGEIFYRNTDWHNPLITQFTPPLVVPAGQGFEWTCTWRNTADSAVNYGLTADDEMCNMTEVHTPFDVTAECEVVETSDGVLWSR